MEFTKKLTKQKMIMTIKKSDLIVVGGGASGLMAAGTAAHLGLKVCLIEKTNRLGWKLSITGKGRCNVTNDCISQEVIANVPTNGRFLFGALSHFSPSDVMRFFESLGVPLKTERGNRVFPQSDRAKDIVDALVHWNKNAGVEIIQGEVKKLLLEDGSVKGVVLADGETVSALQVILCCGGKSYPVTGSTGDGYLLAQQAGHTILPPRPSLVPLCCKEQDCREMMGLSLRNIGFGLYDMKKKKTVCTDFGELLFTHFGLSGPVVLSGSAHLKEMERDRYRADIDLKPALSFEKLDARLQRDFTKYHARDFVNGLSDLLPRLMIPVIVRRSGILESTKCADITREQRLSLVRLLKQLSFTVTGFRPIEEAIVTSGGVKVKEVDPKTMESKKIHGLYFAGELLDVDGYTGGFNLQIAFCTGRLAAQSVAQNVQNQKSF